MKSLADVCNVRLINVLTVILSLCDSSRAGGGGTMGKLSQRTVNEIASKWRELPPIEKGAVRR